MNPVVLFEICWLYSILPLDMVQSCREYSPLLPPSTQASCQGRAERKGNIIDAGGVLKCLPKCY